jgi:murein DD-endopeptidase MepM/ murein hydrolase activator NlpD
MKNFFLLLSLACIPIAARPQVFPSNNYPHGYFRDPLNIPISLAGNFGELRPNHYHMGLDIRTEKRVNLPVFAAADGWVSRIKVEPAGFGQAIYINHPNGYTTLYAHLNDFFPALSAYVKQQQYKTESWKQFIEIPAGLFPVKKGSFIAYSGSTGGSEAPHVHFEIRNTVSDINSNPMLFGLPITDHTAPTLLKLAVYDLSRSVYEQVPRILPVRRSGKSFGIPGGLVIVHSTKIGFAISAFDTNSGTSNRNGIFEAVIYDNGKPVTGFQMDHISYDNTRNINAHIDYKTKATGGPYLQQLFRLYGYVNSIYHAVSGDGIIDISDGKVHNIRIEVQDPYGNTSELVYRLQYQFAGKSNWEPAGKKFYPQMLDGFESGDCAFYIGERCLYDSVHIAYSKTEPMQPGIVSAVHHIGASYIPLQDSFLVRVRPTIDLPGGKKDKVVMQRSDGNKKSVEKVEWQAGWASAKFRDFGSFQLVLDEEPPEIVPVGNIDGANLSKASRIVFIVRDNLGEFRNFRAELDGKWLCFSNDKGKSFVYKFDEHCAAGNHALKISVEDVAGNHAEKTFQFTR